MKRWKVYGCAAVFLLLTAVKMIAPAAAADARAVLVPAIGADDDYRAVFAEIRSAFSTARVGEQDVRLRCRCRRGLGRGRRPCGHIHVR